MTTVDINNPQDYDKKRFVRLTRISVNLKIIFLSLMPGTFYFKLHQGRKVLKLVKNQMIIYDNSKSIPANFKTKYRRRFKRMQLNLKKLAVLRRNTNSFIYYSLFLFGFIIAAIICYFIFNNYYHFTDFQQFIFLIFLGFILSFVMIIFYLAITLLIAKLSDLLATRFLFGWPIFIVITAIIIAYYYAFIITDKQQYIQAHEILLLLLYLIFSVTTFYFGIIFVFYSSTIFDIYSRYKLPKSSISNDLLYLIHSFETNRRSLKSQRLQLQKLEQIAKSIEHYRPRQLPSNDIVTDLWLKIRTKEIATYIREKKRWILTSKKDTNIYLSKEMVYILDCIFDDNWDGLKAMKPEELSKELPQPQFLRSRLTSILRTIFIASLPIIGFLIIQLTSWHINEPYRDYVIIGLFVWVFLVIISAIDPNLNSKIAAFKDITNTFTSLPEKKQ